MPAPDHVRSVYSDDYFSGGGAGYADYLQEAQLLRARGRKYARLLRRYTAPGTLLDVGAAAGFVMQGFADQGWRVAGTEPNSRMAAYARQQLHLEVCATSLEEYRPDRQFDVVTLIQVVPHLVDIRRGLATVAACVRPGGLCLIESWDCRSMSARLLGKHWHEYSPPSVLHWFSKKGLADLMRQSGFSLVSQGRSLKWISCGHAVSLLNYKLAGSRLGQRLLKLAERLPQHWALPYPSEDLFWGLFRKD